MALALEAAAELFAEVGIASATTNAIAARAGMSPGSLYQFFANKDQIVEALATRYIDQLQLVHASAFDADVAELSLLDLVDRVVDQMISFNLANPGFEALLADPAAPAHVAGFEQPLHAAVLARLEAIFTARAPAAPADERRRSAQVAVQIFKGMVPLILSAQPPERDKLIDELKQALRRYLAPLME